MIALRRFTSRWCRWIMTIGWLLTLYGWIYQQHVEVCAGLVSCLIGVQGADIQRQSGNAERRIASLPPNYIKFVRWTLVIALTIYIIVQVMKVYLK